MGSVRGGSNDRFSSILQRIYRVLLVAYPKEFRRGYGDQMAQVFGDQCREERHRGGAAALVGLGLRTIPDLVVSAFGERRKSAERGALALVKRTLDRAPQDKGRARLVVGGLFVAGNLITALTGAGSMDWLMGLAAGGWLALSGAANLWYATNRSLALALRLAASLATILWMVAIVMFFYSEGGLRGALIHLGGVTLLVTILWVLFGKNRYSRGVERALAWIGGVDRPRR